MTEEGRRWERWGEAKAEKEGEGGRGRVKER